MHGEPASRPYSQGLLISKEPFPLRSALIPGDPTTSGWSGSIKKTCSHAVWVTELPDVPHQQCHTVHIHVTHPPQSIMQVASVEKPHSMAPHLGMQLSQLPSAQPLKAAALGSLWLTRQCVIAPCKHLKHGVRVSWSH